MFLLAVLTLRQGKKHRRTIPRDPSTLIQTPTAVPAVDILALHYGWLGRHTTSMLGVQSAIGISSDISFHG